MLNRLIILITIVLVLSVSSTRAFGAGNIPTYSFLENKAFRHGDIEDTLVELIKKTGGFLGRNSKFGGLDISRIYFGNWLRDYSQAVDIAGLSKVSLQSILNLVMALGFLANGYATGEFEVTKERLGVYSCCEHIDNPKGYASDQPNGDARHLDPRLRGLVDPRELEIDERTGMKNYIANETGGWETSSNLVRNRIRECIALGRKARKSGSENDVYESYRLLGSLLHTLEDFSAHSNWCELSLRRLGFPAVFCHVGDQALISTPDGPAPPLVTGTFGGSDFIHSLIGETSDHISEASVSDLAQAMGDAKKGGGSRERGIASDENLGAMLNSLPGGSGSELNREMNGVNEIRSRAGATEMTPQELHAALWKILAFRDNVVKTIEKTIERIPGMSKLVEKITDAVNRFIFTTLEPLLKPIMVQATAALGQGSSAVIASNLEQFEVFDQPFATDPTHSFLAKDHFNLILNEPAGKVAIVIVSHTVKAIVKAWDEESIDPQSVADKVLTAFHHPYFYNDNSEIQREMGTCLKNWIKSQSEEDKAYILNALTKESVRAGRNKRKGHVEDQAGHGCGGLLSPEKVSDFAQQHIPGASAMLNTFNEAQGTFNSVQNYGRRDVEADYSIPSEGTFMPPPGAPPMYHGQREPIPTVSSSYSETSFDSNYQCYNPPPPSPPPQVYDSQYQYQQQQETQFYQQDPQQQQQNYGQQFVPPPPQNYQGQGQNWSNTPPPPPSFQGGSNYQQSPGYEPHYYQGGGGNY